MFKAQDGRQSVEKTEYRVEWFYRILEIILIADSPEEA